MASRHSRLLSIPSHLVYRQFYVVNTTDSSPARSQRDDILLCARALAHTHMHTHTHTKQQQSQT